jgi:bifunctional DNA-binding transcriptional regulator/antitoxin component of YhaV-PrlF toxin-antitoxin module
MTTTIDELCMHTMNHEPTYNDHMPDRKRAATHYTMTVSRNGQVSIPAAARARWHATQVLVEDVGEYVTVRPLDGPSVESLRGKYKDRGPSTDAARQQARAEDHARS